MPFIAISNHTELELVSLLVVEEVEEHSAILQPDSTIRIAFLCVQPLADFLFLVRRPFDNHQVTF